MNAGQKNGRGTGAGSALVLAGCSGLPTLPGLGGGSKPQKHQPPGSRIRGAAVCPPSGRGTPLPCSIPQQACSRRCCSPVKPRRPMITLQAWCSSGYYNGLTVSRVEKDFPCGGRAGGRRQRHHHLERQPLPGIEVSDKLHHYSGALCMGHGHLRPVRQRVLRGGIAAGRAVGNAGTGGSDERGSYRAEVVSAYQTAGGAPYLDYTDTVLGQVYEGMDVVDAIGQAAVDENQKPT